jgi:hypothetical protein
VLVLAAAAPATAHDAITTNLTWTQEISRIVYKKCVNCHREGGAAPMPLTTYDEARPWAKAIRDEVLERRMPPWAPVKGVGQFRHDPSLSQPELDMLVGWVEGGAPKGEEIYLPAMPAAGPAPQPPPRGRDVAVAPALALPRALRIAAIRPRNVPEHGAFEVAAIKPDGAVERLIWIRDFRAKWNRTYVLQSPVSLPGGTRLKVFAAPGASATLTAVATPAP